jgi:hypothetical protein
LSDPEYVDPSHILLEDADPPIENVLATIVVRISWTRWKVLVGAEWVVV